MSERQRDLLNGKLKMENGKLNTLKIFNFQLSIFNSRVAFTLAEVLITLAVIGVVAAITMPILITKYKKLQTVEQLITTYSTLSQAFKMAEADYGTIDQWDIPANEDNPDSESGYTLGKNFANKYLLPYLKNIKECERGSNDCWGEDYVMLNGTPLSARNFTYGVFLNNGILLGIVANGPVIEIYTDINGKKAPNKVGIDLFDFVLLNAPIHANTINADKPGFYFYGHGLTRDELLSNTVYQGCSSEKTGFFCGALIMQDGWRIKKDYPW